MRQSTTTSRPHELPSCWRTQPRDARAAPREHSPRWSRCVPHAAGSSRCRRASSSSFVPGGGARSGRRLLGCVPEEGAATLALAQGAWQRRQTRRTRQRGTHPAMRSPTVAAGVAINDRTGHPCSFPVIHLDDVPPQLIVADPPVTADVDFLKQAASLRQRHVRQCFGERR